MSSPCYATITVYILGTVANQRTRDKTLVRRFILNIFSRILLVSGAIIGYGDRKHTPFLVVGLSLWYGKIYFLNKVRHRVRHARVLSARGFADVARGNGVQRCLMLLAHNSTRRQVAKSAPGCARGWCSARQARLSRRDQPAGSWSPGTPPKVSSSFCEEEAWPSG